MEDTREKKSSHVQSVERAMMLLDIMAQAGRDASLTDISRRCGWAKSTVYGILSTLRDYRVVEQSEENGHYRLGSRLFELGNIVAKSWDVCSLAKPHLRRLSEMVGETVHLAMESDGEVLYLDKVESKQMIRIVSEVGGRLPMHCSGLGKALLAYMSEIDVRMIAEKKGLVRMTERTITTLPGLFSELERVRSQGYSLDDGEIMDNLRCVAAPIFDMYGTVRYAVSVSGLDSNMRSSALGRAIQQVMQTAGVISGAMGASRGVI
jgi:DNA-binding IclR family transcriptional regulator